MTINVHSLNHLTQTVEDLEPFWVYSCFFFESLNDILLQHVHGTQGFGLQFVSNFSYFQSFLTAVLQIDNGPLFLNRTIKPPVKKFTHGVGKGKALPIAVDELDMLNDDIQILQSYTRIKIDGILFCVKSWHENSRRHNCTIKFSCDNKCHFGHITKIIECADNSFKLFTEIVRCERITDDISLS